MATPRLTILMPTLNAARYLREAIESVRAGQLTADEVELLIIDGGSSDETQAIARSYAPLVRLIVERDDTLYDALNRGLSAARSELIGWLNADDRYTADGPARLVAAFTSDDDCVYGDYDNWDEARDRHRIVRQHDGALGCYRDGDLEHGWVMPITAIWRRAALQRLGGWDRSFRIAGDLDLWIRAALLEPRLRERYVPQMMGIFRTHEGSLSSGGRHVDRLLAEDLRLADSVVRRIDLPHAMRATFEERLRERVRWSVWSEVRRGRWSRARELVRQYGRADDSVGALVKTHLLAAGGRRLRNVFTAAGVPV